MPFRRIVERYPTKSQRFLEILPGFVSWSLILFPVWGSLVIPEAVAYYVIMFSVYWLYRSLTLAVLSVVAHLRIRKWQQMDWVTQAAKIPDSSTVHHLIIIPTYKEPLEILERTLTSLKEQTWPLSKIHIMLSFEEREGKPAIEKAEHLVTTYGKSFGHLWYTLHPDLPGEVKGKSSNTSWGAKRAKELLVDKAGVKIDRVTITSQDADARLHPSYFACLATLFASNPKRHLRTWQGAINFYNNIWRVPAPIRVLATNFSVNQMFILMRKDRLINFSTYSTSLKLIDQIGYWDTDVIPEDYRLFFKAYFKTGGQVEVDPIFLPIYADAAEAGSLVSTLVNQYEQIKRWAWGVSDDAYIIKQYLTIPNVPFWDKTIRVLKVMEDHFLWPVNWFAITLSALVPPLLNPDFARTVMGRTLPQVVSAILTLSLISLVVVLIVDARSRPPRPATTSLLARLIQPVEFLLLPVVGFFFSALPGLEAHTRLMLGRHIEYRVTEKVSP